MKKIKRIFLSITLLAVALVLVACENSGNTDTKKDTLVVGSSDLNGNFVAGFGNSAYDNWVRTLIHGYGTVAVTPDGQMLINETVVKSSTTSLTPRTVDGATVEDKTYRFVLQEDLKWSDGTALTAEDFVYGILYSASTEWKTAGATTTAGDSLVGYDAYRAAASANVAFKGVHLESEYVFSVTISGEHLPYFYELAYASFGPMPMHHLAPSGATISSTSTEGAKISANGFSTMKDHVAVGGYRYAPTVTAGQYKFVSFVNQVVTLVLDENYKGNYEGKKATIKNVIVRRVNTTLDVDMVISGEIDLTTGVIEGAKIQKAQASDKASLNYYARNGYGLLAMVAHMQPTSDYRVRQAIAHLTDRQYVASQVLEGYGSMVYSEYGLAQWMYQQSEAWVDANLNKYEFSVSRANTILDTTDYKFESNGTTPFDPAKATAGSNYFRHNAAKEVLTVNHFGTENNAVTDSLSARFTANLQLAGIKYSIQLGTFDTLIDHYYYGASLEAEDKVYSTFNLATNFTAVYDPYYSWSEHLAGTDYNPHSLVDTKENPAAPLETGEKSLQELMEAMRVVPVGQNAQYLELWRQYQLRWNKLIPNVPLYSNQYYDVYTSKLEFDGVTTTPFWTWADAIPYMILK